MKTKPELFDDPKAEKAFFQGMAWAFGCSEETERKIFNEVLAEDEATKQEGNKP